ncbi:MAG: hypothetical protein HOW59_02430 [Nonomuraea sp.]|nr:hypothetical protein [Nonomuraea sp.]NUQ31319.1 hypothetical protein [Dermatophilaceae bacterium]NUR81055.1 hypothetical protein [Dermatophilaceae bacterium]
MTLAPVDSPTQVSVQDFTALAHAYEVLEESLVDAQLALEDNGWARLDADTTLTREQLRTASRLARVMCIADPLIRRAMNLRIAYVWGSGLTIQASQGKDGGQDVNAVIQAFLDDESNQASFTSGQAHEELERRLGTGGDNFEALPTSPLTGRVQVRNIPADEIDDVILNPEDRDDPWFYKRTFTRTVVETGYSGQTRTRRETRTVYYPALGYWPKLRPSTIDGKPVEWGTPVLHTFVNRPEGSKWGVGDLHAALPWARGYKEFLEDWARLVKALSRFAFRATAKNRAGAAKVRQTIGAAAVGADGQVGQTAITGEDQKFEAIGKSGATIDSNSGRPLAAMVAAGTDVPVTMLLADPGVTGARATAETLDKPLELIAGMRRDLHGARLRKILNYVIDQAIKAPQGALRGVRVVDQVTGRELMRLANEQDRGIDIAWPDLSDEDLKTKIDAIVAANDTELMPELVVLRLILAALGVDNADEVIEAVTDANGNFVAPRDATAARSQQNAIAAGDVPKD